MAIFSIGMATICANGIDHSMYPLADGVTGWQPEIRVDSQAISTVGYDPTKACPGWGSLRATVESIPNHSNKWADLTDIMAVGIKIGAKEAPGTEGFTGDIWIDAFSWTKPALDFRGISYTAWSAEEYISPSSDASLFRLKATGANYVALLVTGYMDTGTSTTIYADPVKTPSDESLIHAIKVAHSYGLRVMLKPHVDSKDGTWRGEIAPVDVDGWFANYADFIVRYAELAQEHGVELFCVGAEFRSLSSAEYRMFWERIIAAVRGAYTGPLVYAANWDEYTRVSFWDLVDYVGINAYFPLSDRKTPSVDELVRAWRPWTSAIDAWRAAVKKRVIFTEIGYRSIDYAAREPWNWTDVVPYNAEAQANCYEAVFQALSDKPWFAGMFWWNWLTDPNAGGPGDIDYTPQNKPAQEVLTRWFSERFAAIADFAGDTRSLAFLLRLNGRIDDADSIVGNMNFIPYNAFTST